MYRTIALTTVGARGAALRLIYPYCVWWRDLHLGGIAVKPRIRITTNFGRDEIHIWRKKKTVPK